MVVGLISPDFGTGVVGSPSLSVGQFAAIDLGDVQIPKFVVLAMDENVGTLEVPMEDSFLVEMVECCDDVGGEIPNADFVDFAEILFGVVDELMQVTSIWVVRELPANYITMQRTWSLSSKKASL